MNQTQRHQGILHQGRLRKQVLMSWCCACPEILENNCPSAYKVPCSSTLSNPWQESHINCSHFLPDIYIMYTGDCLLPQVTGHEHCAMCCNVSLLHATTDARYFLESVIHLKLWFALVLLFMPGFQVVSLSQGSPFAMSSSDLLHISKPLLYSKDRMLTQTLFRDL